MITLVKEFAVELRAFLTRGGWVDVVIPPIVFTAVAVFSTPVAVVVSVVFAVWLVIMRVVRGEQFWYAVGGVAGIGISLAAVALRGDADGFFLPSIVTSVVIALLCAVSLLARKPFVAWTSHWYRGHPWEWYWHPRVRPAYSEPTILWLVFFAVRAIAQISALQTESIVHIAVVDQILGWPSTITLLLLTFLYGRWRLRNLGGPSVDEFNNGTPPPWKSQQTAY